MKIIKSTEAPRCIHNDAVLCWPSARICERCGWDPEVAAERLVAICRRMGWRYELAETSPDPIEETETKRRIEICSITSSSQAG